MVVIGGLMLNKYWGLWSSGLNDVEVDEAGGLFSISIIGLLIIGLILIPSWVVIGWSDWVGNPSTNQLLSFLFLYLSTILKYLFIINIPNSKKLKLN